MTNFEGLEMDTMDRVDCILSNTAFRRYMARNAEFEKARVFCRHDLSHVLDVCRVAWILCLEGQCHYSRELVYAAGLLHDIGRWVEYENGEDHAAAGARLADEILKECGFTEVASKEIMEAIGSHRGSESQDTLAGFIRSADKLSRPCFDCAAKDLCKRFQNNEVAKLTY